MVKIIWNFGEPPKDMMVRQVYAIAFDKYGRVMLKSDIKDGKRYFGMILLSCLTPHEQKHILCAESFPGLKSNSYRIPRI